MPTSRPTSRTRPSSEMKMIRTTAMEPVLECSPALTGLLLRYADSFSLTWLTMSRPARRSSAFSSNCLYGMVAGAGGGGGPGGEHGDLEHTELHRLSTAWGEGTTGIGDAQIGGTGQGFAAGPGDATWNASSYPNTLWTKPGGDFSPTIGDGIKTTVSARRLTRYRHGARRPRWLPTCKVGSTTRPRISAGNW